MNDLDDTIISSKDQTVISKPSLFWLATEGHRALFEWSTFLPFKYLRQHTKSGDGHPVLVMPGFMASDTSTSPLRSYLDDIGYDAHGWQLGRNYGSEKYLDLLIEKVEDLFLESRQKVSLIGWSLGGVYAREVAKQKPNLIRQVITLGSPFGGITKPNNAMWMYELLTDGRGTEDVDTSLLEGIPSPAPVPTTAIYSKEDGVVPWQTCIEHIESPIHQNIQVRGSHLGLGVNPIVLRIIEDRLQLKGANWQPFESQGHFTDKLFYPSFS